MTFEKHDLDKALTKAKIAVMSARDSTFLSHCMLNMAHVFDETMPTAYTTGKVCGYNPEFFMRQSPAKRVGLVLHETCHPAFLDFERQGTRCPDLWNMACDYRINQFIIDAGFELPEEGCFNSKYKGWTAEQIYDDLVAQGKKPNPRLMDMKGMPTDPTELRDLKSEWDSILIQAAMASKMAGDKAGSIPGELERYIDSLLNPEVPWHRVLASFMNKMSKTDWTYRKPNKRYRPKYYLPSLYSEAVCNITVAVDTSGSVSKEQFEHFVSESAAIIRNLRPQELTFLQFDTRLQPEVVLRDLRDLPKVKFKGGGGTNINPVMEWAAEKKPSVLIVFTDGYYSAPKTNPKVPVLWVVNDNPGFQAPFGKHIKYTFKNK